MLSRCRAAAPSLAPSSRSSRRSVHYVAPGAYPPPSRVQRASRLRGRFDTGDIELFKEICGQSTDPSRYPLASSVAKNVVVYDGNTIRKSLAASSRGETRDEFMAEFHDCLLHGPGVFAIKGCMPDHSVLDRANAAFRTIIDREKSESGVKGDHFAPAGNNERVWNSFQKHAVEDPQGFVDYYANEVLDAVFEAWLGPGYRVTAQTNIVKPGGRAQQPHRDYHLGFQSEEVASRFPIVSQIASQLLTLQAAVAHTDMPLISGPTQLLPFSQHFDYGYTAYRHPEFIDVFRSSMVQLELAKGDAVFFNPALFHAAGDNDSTDFDRWANLLQVSACWGKPMESVDATAVLRAVWPHVQNLARKAGHDAPGVQALLKAICDGYSFPTNLDKDPPPPDGHCPPTQLDRAFRALESDQTTSQLEEVLERYEQMRLP
ncbi:hypothetical protein JCM24511_09100 [Saitozyma sp. JCM 24511]|nr:hypothetical protein JCM24511_09100 [Saitozyma sp. JCM 24511]